MRSGSGFALDHYTRHWKTKSGSELKSELGTSDPDPVLEEC